MAISKSYVVPTQSGGASSVVASVGPDWDMWAAIGTNAAVIVALALALVQGLAFLRRENRLRKEAERERVSMVSSWVEARFVPSESGTHYNHDVRL